MSWASSPAVRRSMRANKSRGTRPELRLLAALRRRGLRPSLHRADVMGTPDFAWLGARVAVFMDGDFWHGRTGKVPRTHRAFWRAKFAANKARDRRVGRALRRGGWVVIRVWESAVNRDADGCAERVAWALRGRGR